MSNILENNVSNIVIKKEDKNQIIDTFFSGNFKKNIILKENGYLKYLIIAEGSDIDMEIILEGEKSNIEIYGIFISRNSSKIGGNIRVCLNNNFVKSDVYMLSLLSDKGISSIQGKIDIDKNVRGVAGNLSQDNIVLGEKVSIKTLPLLSVYSNDVTASHGAKIDRIDKDKLFYMMSKGISIYESKKLIIKGYLNFIFGKFDEYGEEEKEKLINYIVGYLI